MSSNPFARPGDDFRVAAERRAAAARQDKKPKPMPGDQSSYVPSRLAQLRAFVNGRKPPNISLLPPDTPFSGAGANSISGEVAPAQRRDAFLGATAGYFDSATICYCWLLSTARRVPSAAAAAPPTPLGIWSSSIRGHSVFPAASAVSVRTASRWPIWTTATSASPATKLRRWWRWRWWQCTRCIWRPARRRARRTSPTAGPSNRNTSASGAKRTEGASRKRPTPK
jgi:hypothetical protein